MTAPMPAPRELAALLAATRPDWGPDDIRYVLARCTARPWPQLLLDAARLAADADAVPDDLLTAPSEAWRQRRPPQPADTAHRGAALARAAVHRTTDTEGNAG